ncbi:hypothetical protein PILCRDRAFT_810577, partial [Piloderma croceum F 1598]
MLWGLGGHLLFLASASACRSRLSRVPVPSLALWKYTGNETLYVSFSDLEAQAWAPWRPCTM